VKEITDYQAGETITIESTYPGIFVERLPSGYGDYAIALCVLPEYMIDGSGEIESTDWNAMLASLWASMKAERDRP